MLTDPKIPAPTALTVPERWRSLIQAHLDAEETPIAWVEIDLDQRMHYSAELVLITQRRVFDFVGDGRESRIFPLSACVAMERTDHAGVGTLHLQGDDCQLASWQFSFGRNKAVGHLIERFNSVLRGEAIGDPTIDQTEESSSRVNTKPSTSALWRLKRFAKPRALPIALGVALTFASTAIALVPPYLTRPIVDKILIPHHHGETADLTLAAWLLAGLVGAAILAWGMNWGRTFILAWVSERIGSDLRTKTYEHLQTLSLEYFGGMRTGDLIARIGSDTDRINTFLSVYLLNFATDILAIIMTAVILVSIDPLLALFSLGPIPLLIWLLQRVRNRLRQGFEWAARAWAEMTNVLADTIPGVRVVKAFAQERREVARFRRANDHVLEVNDKVNTIWAFFASTVTLGTDVGLVVVWTFGIWSVSQDTVSVGTLTAFVAYISRFYARLESMSRIASFTLQAAASAERLFDILDRVPTVPEPANPVAAGRLSGTIELRDVGFRYGNRSVLSGINLSIPPGKMIGLVGPSGSGKSTLVNLVCRFYDVSEGAILVDGVDIRSFAVSDFRSNIGLVLQEPFLFYGSIADNIGYGSPDEGRNQIIAAARAARAHEFILRVPDGYDSLVGERGQFLSGGERQRISIARALLIDPRILILDEATSSVDTETEREIQEALDNLVRGRTTLAIAHRLSTLRRADWVAAMESGTIAEVGTHDELMATGGVYARLYNAQATGSDEHLEPPLDAEPARRNHEAIAPPPDFSLFRDPWGQLVADLGEAGYHVGVQPVRAFPISAPTHAISICDAKGHELVWIDDLAQVSAAVRTAVEDALILREFVPIITRIVHSTIVADQAEWDVDTNRGRTHLRLENQNTVRYLTRTSLRIVDDYGIRYMIPDIRVLDRASRRILERYLH